MDKLNLTQWLTNIAVLRVMKYFGHVIRSGWNLETLVIQAKVQEKRSKGCPPPRWTDRIIKQSELPLYQCVQRAKDRRLWHTIHIATWSRYSSGVMICLYTTRLETPLVGCTCFSYVVWITSADRGRGSMAGCFWNVCPGSKKLHIVSKKKDAYWNNSVMNTGIEAESNFFLI